MKKHFGLITLSVLAAACSSPAKTFCPGPALVDDAGNGVGCAPVDSSDTSIGETTSAVDSATDSGTPDTQTP